MRKLVLLAMVGFAAQLVDGSLGMAYGVTSTTLLLFLGTNPASASAMVHLAEIGTTLMSGAAHHRFGNVDWSVVLKIGLPGAVGAFAGATFLSQLDTAAATPVMATVLLVLGLYVLVRFTVQDLRQDRLGQPLRKRFLAPLGLFAGFLDATGGGGWGPVGTPAILASGRLEPRKVIGSIDTSEFAVSVAASAGFLLALGSSGVNPVWVLGLLLGGALAAPIAAWLVRHLPPRVLGPAVGGLIVVTNSRTLLNSDWLAASSPQRWVVYAVLLLGWGAAVTYSVHRHRSERRVRAEQRELALDPFASTTAPTCRTRSREAGPDPHQPRSRHCGRCGRSAPSVVSSPWPG